jgi:hypothetical protein
MCSSLFSSSDDVDFNQINNNKTNLIVIVTIKG